MNMLLKERQQFIAGVKLKPDGTLTALSLKNKEDYYSGMEKAFDDAFNQYARRERKKYADEKRTLMTPVVERLFAYFNSAQDSFDRCFDDCIALSKKILSNDRFGIAQKFTNMSFKYLFCFGDAAEFEEKFRQCHMPLDRYTIHWIRALNNKGINQRLNEVNSAWANIEKPLYDDIQQLVTITLAAGHAYRITYNQKAQEQLCVLPQNKLEAEFIVWRQEQLDELYRIIKKAEPDFERLGIQWL